MKITERDNLLVLDFERQGASWALLVADDRWDFVKRMVCGNPAGGISGIGADCLSSEKIEAYWEPRRRSVNEPFVRSLLFLPFVAHQKDEIAAILFAPFPPALTAATIKNDVPVASAAIAALIDVINQSGDQPQVGFEDVWKVLDETGRSPNGARAMFTRGGALHELSDWCKNVYGIPKQHEEHGVDTFSSEFDRWWKSVTGDLATGASVFQKITQASPTHGADTIKDASVADVNTVLSTMCKHDPYGAWRWCKESKTATVDETYQRLWLAAKSLQTSPLDANCIPVTALIALLNGLSLLRAAHPFLIDDPLDTVSEENLVMLKALGSAMLKAGNMSAFCIALRDWILHPEQFLPGHARISRVQLAVAGNEVVLDLSYTGTLPVAVFNSGVRNGNAWNALNRLKTFGDAVVGNEHANVTLKFRHEA